MGPVAPGRSARTTERPPGLSRQGCRFFVVLCTRPRSTLFGGNWEQGRAARIIPDKPARPLVFRQSRSTAHSTPLPPSTYGTGHQRLSLRRPVQWEPSTNVTCPGPMGLRTSLEGMRDTKGLLLALARPNAAEAMSRPR